MSTFRTLTHFNWYLDEIGTQVLEMNLIIKPIAEGGNQRKEQKYFLLKLLHKKNMKRIFYMETLV